MSDEPVVTKPWALLAYTVADDQSTGGPIDAPVKHELKAICDASDFHQISVAAQVDFKSVPGVFRASILSMPSSRGFETIPAEKQPLWKDILARLQESSTLKVQKDVVDTNAANGGVLSDFLRFGLQECPAERYVVVMYGHSSGPMGLFYDTGAGEFVPNTLRLNDLADAIRTVEGRAAVVVFRDCFMSTLEAAYQLRGAADFMIASQSEVPIAGIWPWRELMKELKAGVAAADLARAFVNAIGAFLDEQGNRGPFADAPLSLIDLHAAGAIAEPLKALVDALETARVDRQRCRACARALEGARVGYVDHRMLPGDAALLDVPTMCDNLERLAPDPVAAPARALGEVVRSRLVVAHHTQANRYQGTSIYYKPVHESDLDGSHIQTDGDVWEEDMATYKRLALNVATGWDRIALNPLVAVTIEAERKTAQLAKRKAARNAPKRT